MERRNAGWRNLSEAQWAGKEKGGQNKNIRRPHGDGAGGRSRNYRGLPMQTKSLSGVHTAADIDATWHCKSLMTGRHPPSDDLAARFAYLDSPALGRSPPVRPHPPLSSRRGGPRPVISESTHG